MKLSSKILDLVKTYFQLGKLAMTNYFNLSGYKELLEVEKNGKFSSLLDPEFAEFLQFQVSMEAQMAYNRKEE